MSKRTWKKRGIGPSRIREALASTRSLSDAARALGVDRSTLHRWMEADPTLKDARGETDSEIAAAHVAMANDLTPDEWAESIRGSYDLTATEQTLLDLARRSLVIAREGARPSEQLAAMGRFQKLVLQLDLEKPESGQAQATKPRLRVVA